ncbi:cell division protein FtsQ, putative [Roseobacter denitrificans OCh 114]|uniref:Cell division protein FtsQ n=2 Tax=Roseobacter denitrificans TaxID=2434 RepID=Q163J5_ROSDO|nr:cell division protein FtsQ, putative [Roseobacter denitrificans OCh 114]
MQRLLLTPAFLLFLRAGVPVLLLFGAATWWLSDADRRAAIWETVAEARASFETRPEFMVQLMAIDGATDALAAEIRKEVPLDFPLSSFDLNLSDMRDRIVALDPVKSATVRIRPGGVLHIDVEPRMPAVIWRSAQGLTAVDVNGIHVGPIAQRMDRPDLPLIAGTGATEHVKEALDLYRAAGPLGTRLRGIVRVGERRWDIVLDRDQRILLPEDGAVEALDRVIALDTAQDILSRDVKRVDLRLGARPTVKMSDYATNVWWEIRQVSRQ